MDTNSSLYYDDQEKLWNPECQNGYVCITNENNAVIITITILPHLPQLGDLKKIMLVRKERFQHCHNRFPVSGTNHLSCHKQMETELYNFSKQEYKDYTYFLRLPISDTECYLPQASGQQGPSGQTLKDCLQAIFCEYSSYSFEISYWLKKTYQKGNPIYSPLDDKLRSQFKENFGVIVTPVGIIPEHKFSIKNFVVPWRPAVQDEILLKDSKNELLTLQLTEVGKRSVEKSFVQIITLGDKDCNHTHIKIFKLDKDQQFQDIEKLFSQFYLNFQGSLIKIEYQLKWVCKPASIFEWISGASGSHDYKIVCWTKNQCRDEHEQKHQGEIESGEVQASFDGENQ